MSTMGKIDRAEFVRRTEDDIITCTREGSCELVAGHMLNALVWFTKVPLLRSLREYKDFAFESELVCFEDARNDIMTNLPTFANVGAALGEAFNVKPSRKSFTLADIQESAKKLEAMNPEQIPVYRDHGNGVREVVGYRDANPGDYEERRRAVFGKALERSCMPQSASLDAIRAHKQKLAQDGETFYISTFRDMMSDQLVITERVYSSGIPLRMVFITGQAFEAWAHDRHRAYLAQGRRISPGENMLLDEDYEQLLSSEYAHACHPNAMQIGEATRKAMYQTPSSGVAIAKLYEAQGFTIKQEMKSADPDRIAKLFAEDLHKAMNPVRKVRWRDIGADGRRDCVARWMVKWGEAIAARYTRKA